MSREERKGNAKKVPTYKKKGWPADRESLSVFNRRSRNFQHYLSFLLEYNRQARIRDLTCLAVYQLLFGGFLFFHLVYRRKPPRKRSWHLPGRLSWLKKRRPRKSCPAAGVFLWAAGKGCNQVSTAAALDHDCCSINLVVTFSFITTLNVMKEERIPVT